LYYRKYTDKIPQLTRSGTQVFPLLPPGTLPPLPTARGLTYLNDIKLFGVSLGKQVEG